MLCGSRQRALQDPEDWAMRQMNPGTALSTLGERESGWRRRSYFTMLIEGFRCHASGLLHTYLLPRPRRRAGASG